MTEAVKMLRGGIVLPALLATIGAAVLRKSVV